MLWHPSNLIHLLLIAGIWLFLLRYLHKTSATRFRATLRILQILPVLFLIDIFVGFLVIDNFWGPKQSASWIAKTIWIYPGLFVLCMWRLLRARPSKPE